MSLLRNIIRSVKRVDRATGRIRDGITRGAVRLVRAYRKRNGQRVKAHKRVIGGPRGPYAVKTVKRHSNGKNVSSRLRTKPASSRSNVQ